jgi:predicted transcriptional regulator
MGRKKLSENSVKYTILLPYEMEQGLQTIADGRGMNLASVMRVALEEFVKREGVTIPSEEETHHRKNEIIVHVEDVMLDLFQKIKTESGISESQIISDLLRKHLSEVIEEFRKFREQIQSVLGNTTSGNHQSRSKK